MHFSMIIHKNASKKNCPPEIISTNCTHQEHSTYYLLNYLAIYKTNFSEILTVYLVFNVAMVCFFRKQMLTIIAHALLL